MQTRIHPKFAGDRRVVLAEEILRSCVHCGFCNATCPTYQELADERDGPRGRIYLLKEMLARGGAGEPTRRHLDRCLTCRSCETTCPSGVAYAKLADIGRELLEEQGRRPWPERLKRRLLRLVVPWPRRFGAALALARAVRALMPAALRARLPARQADRPRPAGSHTRRVLLLAGCVQSVVTPRTNSAAARVLDRLGIAAVEPPGSGCCGAVSYHLSAHDEARQFIRRNLDAWRPYLDDAEAIVSCSSGCGAMLKDYADIMHDDAAYAPAARLVSARVRDLGEVVDAEDLSPLSVPAAGRTALHCPCTLTHALQGDAAVRRVLHRVGIELVATAEDHLCCGSAGTYSLLQPELSGRLLTRKLQALTSASPALIATANVGCQLHLASAAPVPVRHWIELLDSREDAC